VTYITITVKLSQVSWLKVTIKYTAD